MKEGGKNLRMQPKVFELYSVGDNEHLRFLIRFNAMIR
jgi:hypothetical protein